MDGLGTDISITFSDGGSQKWAEMTRTHVNKVMAIMLDDMVGSWHPK
jgi:preprotein translocase subunit SecD